MKKILPLVVVMMFLCSSAFAAAEDLGEGMGQKAARGFVNFFTGIVEVPAQIIKGYNNGFEPIENEFGSKLVGTVLGFFRGFSHAGGRMSWGALELFGFWTANPADNEGVGVPLDAEYAWEEGTQYSIFEPTLGEGIKPMGRKLGRGLANSFLGIVEVPGQIKKGANDGNVAKGVVKGIWYWFSREAYGFGGIMSALVPNPPDNPGVAFDQENAWDALSE